MSRHKPDPSRRIFALARHYAARAIDAREALAGVRPDLRPRAELALLQARKLASDLEELAVDEQAARSEAELPILAAIEAKASASSREVRSDPPGTEAAPPPRRRGRPPVEKPPRVPFLPSSSWRVFDAAGREVGRVESSSAEGARKKARKRHPGLRGLRVERRPGA